MLLLTEFLFSGRSFSELSSIHSGSQARPGSPRLAQELSLVLTVLNWALAAGLWCFRLSPPRGLPEGLNNKHKLKEVDVWCTVSY